MRHFLVLTDVTFHDGALKGLTVKDGHRVSYPTREDARAAAQALRDAAFQPTRTGGFGGTTWSRIRTEAQ